MSSQQYALEVVTGPTDEPVGLADLRAHLRLAASIDDDEISRVWIPAARELIEKTTGLRLMSQTLKMSLDRFPIRGAAVRDQWLPCGFELPVHPVASVSSVKYLDPDEVEQTLSTSAYTADVNRRLARVVLNQGYTWPAAKAVANAVRVTFVAGWSSRAAVPASLRAAVMLQSRALYDGETDLTETVERLVNLNWSGSLDAST
jgi:uncharacterized phiE125 gp8 family phage protein